MKNKDIAMQYIFQRDLPEYLLNKGFNINKKDDISLFAWHYKEAKQVLTWLSQNQYIPRYISPRLPAGHKLYGSSFYIGDRTKSIQENIKDNLLKFENFINVANLELGENIFYVLMFESLSHMSLLNQTFLNMAVIHGGEYLLKSEGTIGFIEKCKELGFTILALEAFLLYDDGRIQPDGGSGMYYDNDYYLKVDDETYYAKYHIQHNADVGHWAAVKQFLTEKKDSKYYYEVHYKSQS